MSTSEAFLSEIRQFLKETGLSPSAFGRMSVRDPNFLVTMQKGRSPRMDTADRVRRFMREYRAKQAPSGTQARRQLDPHRPEDIWGTGMNSHATEGTRAGTGASASSAADGGPAVGGDLRRRGQG